MTEKLTSRKVTPGGELSSSVAGCLGLERNLWARTYVRFLNVATACPASDHPVFRSVLNGSRLRANP